MMRRRGEGTFRRGGGNALIDGVYRSSGCSWRLVNQQ
jgi:hypothetical protein